MAIKALAIAPAPAIDNSFNFGPLAKLGQASPQNDALANLGQRYGTPGPSPSAEPAQPAQPSAGGTTAAFAAPATTADVNAAIAATAARAGMDVPTWKAIASIESSLNPASNANRPTQYKGLFQIGSRGDGSEWATHGKGDIYNPMDNASAAAALAARNNATFKQNFGRDPSPVETYMMHQQGPGFYLNGTMTNVAGNPYPGMSGDQTPQSFAEGWGREIERRSKYFRKSEEASSGNQSGGQDGY